MAKQINPRLRKLAELTYNPSLELPNLEEITEKTSLKTNKLERDAQGKPIIKLTPLERTAVNTQTQEAYDTLMQVYECGGWRWYRGSSLTSGDHWKGYKEKICMDAGYNFHNNQEGLICYGPTRDFNEKGKEIISPQEFYNKQNITPEMINEINKYFENEK